MGYKYSQLDKENLKWFEADNTRQTLESIDLYEGRIRSLKPCSLEFEYPISAIAGKNGSGKSTILALAACAFHHSGKPTAALPGRKYSYYTFSDFFVQSAEELPPEGITIYYGIRHNGWSQSAKLPDGSGLGYQRRQKKHGGKWTEYNRRVEREVMFFGISRLVPHSEKSVAVGYRSVFKALKKAGWEEKVAAAVGKILGNSYDDFQVKQASKYRLPLVIRNGGTYSGFNMGAGENALFELLSHIYSCPSHALIFVDELELGLHEQAQRRLVHHLKELCRERYIQVICTTHSPVILESLPPEARYFVESTDSRTLITQAISPNYAVGKLSGRNGLELDIMVEDEVAAALMLALMKTGDRVRVRILPIGSHTAVVRHLAARFKDDPTRSVVAVLDGDQAGKAKQHEKSFLNALETVPSPDLAKTWLSQRLSTLPGDAWPERWMLQQLRSVGLDEFSSEFHLEPDAGAEVLDDALRADAHDEFRILADALGIDQGSALRDAARIVTKLPLDELQPLRDFLAIRLAPEKSKVATIADGA